MLPPMPGPGPPVRGTGRAVPLTNPSLRRGSAGASESESTVPVTTVPVPVPVAEEKSGKDGARLGGLPRRTGTRGMKTDPPHGP